MAERPAANGVQSVERVFDLLELITDAGGEVTLSELSSSTELPLPTIHRLLRTLVAKGYVRQLANRRYALGPRLIRLGEGASKQLGALARPQLTSLVEALGETSNMAVLDSDMVVYIAQVPSKHSMRMFTEVGRRAHTHATGVGKAILAQLDDAAVRNIVARAGMPRRLSRTSPRGLSQSQKPAWAAAASTSRSGPTTRTSRCPLANTSLHGNDRVGFSALSPVNARSSTSESAYTTRPIPVQ